MLAGLVNPDSGEVRLARQQRRLNLAAALMHDAQVILLHEPTVGVYPQSRASNSVRHRSSTPG